MCTAFRDGFQSVYGARVLTPDFLPALEAAREAGFEVVGAIALVDRGMGAGPLLAGAGVPYAAAFELDDLTDNAGSPSSSSRTGPGAK